MFQVFINLINNEDAVIILKVFVVVPVVVIPQYLFIGGIYTTCSYFGIRSSHSRYSSNCGIV